MENINKDAEFLKDAKFRGLCEEALEKLILIHEPENRASEVQFDIESHCIITSLILIPMGPSAGPNGGPADAEPPSTNASIVSTMIYTSKFYFASFSKIRT